jgi:threonine/homoserine/homoserine lactone efflux protein
MGLIFLLFAGVAIGISGAMIPGPLTLFTISEVMKSNRFAGLKIVAGHVVAEFIFILVILFGFQNFLSSKGFLSTTTIIGGLTLIFMGSILIINAPKMKVVDKKSNSGFSKGLFLGGIFFSVISPGFIVWWATIGVSTVIRSLLLGLTGVVALTLGHWLADVGWYWSLSYALDKGRKHLNDRIYQNIIRFFSAALIVLGIQFLLNVKT